MLPLPAEIWMKIFAFACTDDGSTGRSLSQVSHFFSTFSAPFKYQSLSIRRTQHLISWSRLIRDFSPPHSQTTKYLYIRLPATSLDVSDDEDDEDYYGSPMDVAADLDSKDSEYEGEFTEEEKREVQDDIIALQGCGMGCDSQTFEAQDSDSSSEKEMRQTDNVVIQALRNILQHVSHSLLILSVHWSSFESYLCEELFPILPLLEELHLHRSFTSQDALEPESELSPSVLFPQLRHLYMSGYCDQRPVSFGQYLQVACPKICSLRLPKGFIMYDKSQNHGLPDGLQAVILQISQLDVDQDTQVLSRLLLGEHWSEARSVGVVYDPYSSSPEQWKIWWSERLSGRLGPWKLGS